MMRPEEFSKEEGDRIMC